LAFHFISSYLGLEGELNEQPGGRYL